MAKFELKKNSITLDICGSVLEVVLTNDVICSCDRLKNNAAELLPKLKQSSDANEVVEGTFNLLVEGIEDILGKDSVGKIFGDKPITLLDLTDVIVFIRGEISAALQKKTQGYRGKK